MKRLLVSLTATFAVLTIVVASRSHEYPAGIIYCPKAAFQITAPQGWVLNNQAGKRQGLDCVLYLQGFSWSDSPVIMYAKIASPNFEDAEAFASWAIKEMETEGGTFTHQRVEAGQTTEFHRYFVNEYRGRSASQFERVVYVQLPHAVAYIVYAARTEKAFNEHQKALPEVLHSFSYTPQFIDTEQ